MQFDPEQDQGEAEEHGRYEPENIFETLAEAVFPEFDDIAEWEGEE